MKVERVVPLFDKAKVYLLSIGWLFSCSFGLQQVYSNLLTVA